MATKAVKLIEDLEAAHKEDRFGGAKTTAAASAAEIAADAGRQVWREAELRRKLAVNEEAAERGAGGAPWLAARAELAEATNGEAVARERRADLEQKVLVAAENRERAKGQAEAGFAPAIRAAVAAAVREMMSALEMAVSANETVLRAMSAGNDLLGYPARCAAVGDLSAPWLDRGKLDDLRRYVRQELGESA